VRVGRITDGARMGNRDKNEAIAEPGLAGPATAEPARDAGGADRNTTAGATSSTLNSQSSAFAKRCGGPVLASAVSGPLYVWMTGSDRAICAHDKSGEDGSRRSG
jgi:hypothetical protein